MSSLETNIIPKCTLGFLIIPSLCIINFYIVSKSYHMAPYRTKSNRIERWLALEAYLLPSRSGRAKKLSLIVKLTGRNFFFLEGIFFFWKDFFNLMEWIFFFRKIFFFWKDFFNSMERRDRQRWTDGLAEKNMEIKNGTKNRKKEKNK